MDAYSSYIMRLTDSRVGELRREAAEDAMSRAGRERRASRWARWRDGLRGRRTPALAPVAPVARPDFTRETGAEPPLRRSA